jgi:hypothetical protein
MNPHSVIKDLIRYTQWRPELLVRVPFTNTQRLRGTKLSSLGMNPCRLAVTSMLQGDIKRRHRQRIGTQGCHMGWLCCGPFRVILLMYERESYARKICSVSATVYEYVAAGLLPVARFRTFPVDNPETLRILFESGCLRCMHWKCLMM